MKEAKVDIRFFTILISICMLYFAAMVVGASYGDKPGVTLVSPIGIVDAQLETFTCIGEEAYGSLVNITLYVNTSVVNFGSNKVTMIVSETEDVVVGTGTTTNTSFTSNFSTVDVGSTNGVFVTWNCYVCNNLTNDDDRCGWAYMNKTAVTEITPTAPYATVVTNFVTDDNKVVYSNSVVINVSAGTDRADVGIANITLFYNITDTSTFNNWSDNGTDIWRELPQTDWTSSGLVNDFESLSATFATDNFTTADRIIYYSATACSNATIVHCDTTSGNQTLTYKYVAEETTIPTFGNVYSDYDGYGGNVTFGTNGTTDYDGTVYLGITAEDNLNINTVVLYVNMTNMSYPGESIDRNHFWINQTITFSGDAETEVVALFNLTGLLYNATDTDAFDDQGWLSWFFEACDNATTANCANSSRYVMYVDRLSPTVSTLANVTDKSECNQINVTITADEAVNYTLLWGVTSGALTNSETSTNYATTNYVNLEPTDLPYTTYYYNFTVCDVGAQCYSSSEYSIRTGLPLCNGWSSYALLNTYDILGNIGANITTHADNVSIRYWNQTSQSYLQWNDGYVTNENVTVYKRDALEIWVNEDTTIDDAWWDEQGNNTLDNFQIFFAQGWNEVPVLNVEGKSFYNYTLAGVSESYGFNSNITYGSWFNSTSKTHRSYALTQNINENMTLTYPTTTWLYSAGNYTWNMTGGWIIDGPNDGSWA